jgi:hypothetical protein
VSGPTLDPFEDSITVVEEFLSLECDVDKNVGVDKNLHLVKPVFTLKRVQ